MNFSDCSIANLVHRHVLFPKKTCVGLWRLALAHSSWRVILHVSTLPRYKERFEEGGVSLAGLAAFELADVFRLYIYIEYLDYIHLLTPIPALADARGRKWWLPDLEFQSL